MKRPWYFLFYLLFAAFAVDASADELEKGLRRDIQESKGILSRALARLQSGDSPVSEIVKLKTVAENIRAAHLLMEERFKLTAEKSATLGSKAIERQNSVVEGYRKLLEAYLALIDALPPDATVSTATLDELRTLLDRLAPQKKRPLLGTLPYKHSGYPAREPAASPTVVPGYKGGNRTVSPADTAASVESPISKEIAELAESLQWNPVLIYEWVKNNVETEWYFGVMKGAGETLRQKRGNDADQASLLVALLRSAGYPARFVRGTIDFFPGIDRLKNLTGIDDPMKIAAFLQKAGVPFKPVIVGGGIANFQVEHVWVESEIPYSSARGAINDGYGKSWLGLDTSIKPQGVAWNAPLEIQGIPFETLNDEYLQTVQAVTPIEFLKSRAKEHLNQSNPGKSWNDLLSTRSIIPDILKIIPASLQFNTIAITGEYTELPVELRHQLRFTAKSGDSELFTVALDVMRLSNQKVVLTYEPESVEDQQIIDSYGGLDNTPSYLVRLRPVLKVDGERLVVARDGLPMGADYTLAIEVITPNGSERIESSQITGNLAVIGIVSQMAIKPAEIPLEEKDAERLLFEEALNYIDRWNRAEDELAAFLKLAVSRPAPTIVTVGGQIDVTYLLDMPHGFEWQGLFIDAGLRRIETITRSGNQERERAFMRISALEGSILENRVFEDDFQVDSISTAKLLQLAATNNTPLVTIDKTNIGVLLPTLPFDDAVKADISNAVNQNLTITIPQTGILYQDWTGIGYVKENKETGEAGWMLSGGIAGGMTAWVPAKWDTLMAKAMSERLRASYSEIPDPNPLEAATVVKIPVTDQQDGTVGKRLNYPLQVKVLDTAHRPVKDARVTFKVMSGGGKLGSSGATELSVTTDRIGIASVNLTLGEQTSANPIYRLAEGKTIADQYGGNVVDARLDNGKSLNIPFIAYGKPGPPDHLRKTHGDGIKGLIHSFAGFVGLLLEDSYGNPIANQPVTFTIAPPTGAPACNKDNTPARLVNVSDPCISSSPTTADIQACKTASASIIEKTTATGAAVEVILGGAPAAVYSITATTTAKNSSGVALAPVGFSLGTLPFGDCNVDNPPSVTLFTTYVLPTDTAGRNIDAGRNGSIITLRAREYLIREGERLVNGTIDCSGTALTCPQIFGSHTSTISTEFEAANILFNGAPGIDKGNGVYEIPYILGPGLNSVRIDGQAVYKYRQHANSCNGCRIDDKLETVTATAWLKVYGVDISIGSPLRIMLDNNNRSRNNLRIKYTIAPADYQAFSANIFLYKITTSAGRVVEEIIDYIPTETKGSGYGTLARGYPFDANAEYKVQLVINYGTGVEIKSDKVPIIFELGALVPDYNHNRKIDDDDLDRALNNDVYYFWVNDDDGHGDTEGTGIPSTRSIPFLTPKIPGTRDLTDWFPVYLDLAGLLYKYPAGTYSYILKTGTPALRYVKSALTPDTSGKYLTDVSTAQTMLDKEIKVIPWDTTQPLDAAFLQGISQGDNGIILIEAVQATTSPLKLQINDSNGQKVYESSLNLSIAGVEQMFRQKNLMREMHQIEQQFPGIIPPGGVTPVAGHSVPNDGMPDRLTPQDFASPQRFSGFDADSDKFDAETGKKNDFVFVHGYNINGQEARGAQAEIFKRLYWSGLRARFWGVTWYGYDSQTPLPLPCFGQRSPDYHVNVRHAFNTGKLLKKFVTDVGLGNATFAAHSLGNMVLSTAVQEGMDYYRYLMVNAAVAEEAYMPRSSFYEGDDGSYDMNSEWYKNTILSKSMYHPRWRYPHENEFETGYKPFLWFSEWYKLFNNTPDVRANLTWRDYFSRVRENPGNKTFVFYAPTDEAFLPFNYVIPPAGTPATYPPNINNVPGLEDLNFEIACFYPEKFGPYPWAFQELTKGRMINDGMSYGGWGFNKDDGYYISCIDPVGTCGLIQPTEANALQGNVLKAKPFFKKNADIGFLYSDQLVTRSMFSVAKQEQLLANEIPALTFAAGHGGVGIFDSGTLKRNVNIQKKYLLEPPNAQWVRPTDKYEWKHNDLYYVSYPYVRLMFDDWVSLINTGDQK